MIVSPKLEKQINQGKAFVDDDGNIMELLEENA